jgi:MoaA/NifB/PqqE/SkfB family radical SAM enzyme
MAFETFTRLIDQWPGLQELVLQGGGEPMMHSRLFDMVAYAARRGIRVTTVSNLTLLSPARAERCVTSGLDALHVSVDGATAETFERIRVGARFEQVVQNLELLWHARDRLKSIRPHLHLIMVVMRQNLHEVAEVVRLAHRWSMESMSVQHLAHDLGEHTLPAHYYPQREFVRAESLQGEDPRRRERYFREARQLARELGLKLRLPQVRPYPSDILGHERCQWPWQKSYISYQGLAMPCCVVGAPDRINFGNVLELGIEQVWWGADYENFRRQLASAQPPDVCRSCGIYNGTC